MGEYITSSLIVEKMMGYNSIDIHQAIITAMNAVFGIFSWLRIYLFVDFVSKGIQYIKTKKSLGN